MSLYPRLRATASRLLADKGQLVSIRRRAAGAYNVETGAAVADPGTIYSGFGVVSEYPLRQVDGQSVLHGDLRVTLEAPSTMVEPVAGDYALIGATEYAVVGASKVAPGGVTVLYKLQVRR